MSRALIVAEQRAGELREITLECVGAAARAGFEPVVAILGETGLADNLVGLCEQVVLAESEALIDYNPELYLPVLAQIIDSVDPALILCGQTSFGMDLAPGLAGRLGLPLVTDLIGIQYEGGRPRLTRQAFGGKIQESLELAATDLLVATIRGGAFSPPEPGAFQTKTTILDPGTPEPKHLRRFLELVAAETADVDITAAEILVSVGRGIGKPENIPLAEALAAKIGATISCSRPVADAGWLPKSRQVGTSGQTVRPKIYLALGISGAFQHVAGMQSAETIIAVNKDPKAPIFQVAHYGLVEDVIQVLPGLTELF